MTRTWTGTSDAVLRHGVTDDHADPLDLDEEAVVAEAGRDPAQDCAGPQRRDLVGQPLRVEAVGVDSRHDEAAREAAECGGHYLDQFTYAERATDWRGNNNIAESVFEQMALERHPVPRWVVVGAGTGGTSATIGRYVRYRGLASRVCVVDPEKSAFLPAFRGDDAGVAAACGSRIEGIGRPRMEPSFVPGAVDRMMKVPDAASVAAVRALEQAIGRKAGGSTGTGLWSALKIVAEMVADGRRGSVVTLLCDPGDRYLDKYYSDAWLAEQGLDIAPYTAAIESLLATGVWPR